MAPTGEIALTDARLNELLADLREDGPNTAAWTEIRETVDSRRLAESERKRLVELNQYITVERATLFARALLESVRAHVTDPAARAAIAADAARLPGVADPLAAHALPGRAAVVNADP